MGHPIQPERSVARASEPASMGGWSVRRRWSRMSSELLGFDPDARLLILNCDDLGMHEAVNIAIFGSIENGVATSCRLMVPCPSDASAIRRRRGCQVAACVDTITRTVSKLCNAT